MTIKTEREKALEQDIQTATSVLVNALSHARIARLREKEGVSNSLPLRLLEVDIEKALATLDWQPKPDDETTYRHEHFVWVRGDS